MDILREIKQGFKHGGALNRLIIINLAVFILFGVIHVFFFLLAADGFTTIVSLFSVPAQLSRLLLQPWSVFSYMFLHTDFLHLLFNMLVLYWFGQFFLLTGSRKQLIYTYLFGGISGAVFFILFYNIFPVFFEVLPVSVTLGASASVMAIMLRATALNPDYRFQLLLIGTVKAKFLVLALVILDFISISGDNSGGHIAHLGGAFYGLLSVFLQTGRLKIQIPTLQLPGFLRFGRKPKVAYRSNLPPRDDIAYSSWKAEKQKEIDRILDKISKSGYQSLSSTEKETLFRVNNGK
jgi:membrane associated rhomboid family serine protease